MRALVRQRVDRQVTRDEVAVFVADLIHALAVVLAVAAAVPAAPVDGHANAPHVERWKHIQAHRPAIRRRGRAPHAII